MQAARSLSHPGVGSPHLRTPLVDPRRYRGRVLTLIVTGGRSGEEGWEEAAELVRQAFRGWGFAHRLTADSIWEPRRYTVIDDRGGVLVSDHVRPPMTITAGDSLILRVPEPPPADPLISPVRDRHPALERGLVGARRSRARVGSRSGARPVSRPQGRHRRPSSRGARTWRGRSGGRFSVDGTGDTSPRVLGEFDLAVATEATEAMAAALSTAASATVVLDVHGLDFIDSTGIRCLVDAKASPISRARGSPS